jgi:tRNA1Val (adenine37-N6)-methyltransferase
MGSGFFRFKQFTIWQDDKVLKVSTDSVILGSIVKNNLPGNRILDIGAGTGILSLMMAVKYPQSKIDAVEIDKHSYQWLLHNIKKSPWHSNISAINSSIEEFTSKTSHKYDLIISNPPFFADMPLPDTTHKKLFKHTTSLRTNIFAEIIWKLLSPTGSFYTILSPSLYKNFEESMKQKNLFPHQIIYIKWKEDKKVERIIANFYFGEKTPIKENLSVRSSLNEYTEEYKNLTSFFYLDNHFSRT